MAIKRRSASKSERAPEQRSNILAKTPEELVSK
jgi:hypothetical protein